ncbi:MAG: zinc ribbon domain-containing protein [Lentisphaerae bacterium]|nr:zinc ribbon domain-containing protein [Lentisphaerota bacterium]
MPTYEYECTRCGHVFEQFHSMTDKRRKRCPKCRGGVRKLIGAGAGILFKGSGFYQTDYRSDSYREGAKKDTPTESKPASKPEKKKEKKPDKTASSSATGKQTST